LLPFHEFVTTPHIIESIRGKEVFVLSVAAPLPTTLGRSDELATTFVGDSNGGISELAPAGLTALVDQALLTGNVTAIVPIDSRSWKGLIAGTDNGPVIAWLDGLGPCPPSSVPFTLGQIVPVGDSFVLVGREFAPNTSAIAYLAHRRLGP
jgi:hypothetical protein